MTAVTSLWECGMGRALGRQRSPNRVKEKDNGIRGNICDGAGGGGGADTWERV